MNDLAENRSFERPYFWLGAEAEAAAVGFATFERLAIELLPEGADLTDPASDE